MNNVWVKMLLSVIAFVSIVMGGFIVMIMVAFGGGGDFYVTLTVIFAGLILLLVLSLIWRFLKPRRRYIIFGAAFSLCLLSIIAFEISNTYHNSFEKVGDQGVNLNEYAPFREGTKAVLLKEASTLQLTENLPKLDGATALYPIYSAFAQAVYPKGEYPSYLQKEEDYVVCTNTVGAYQRLINGQADIIFVAGPSKEQLQMAKDNGVELKLTPIGREAFVFFVNAKNPVNSLSIADIQKIYAGEAKNWLEFGGKNKNIRAFQRPENSGSQTAMNKFMENTPLMIPPKEDVAQGMGGIIKEVSSYRNYDNAIGYSFLYFASEMASDNKIKLLSLNEVAPTRENVANKTYPYASEFYAVTAGSDNPNVEKFIEWVLSEQGQYIIHKTGYTPLK